MSLESSIATVRESVIALFRYRQVDPETNQYRKTHAPHGIEPGPRRGCALSAIRDDLERLGATVV